MLDDLGFDLSINNDENINDQKNEDDNLFYHAFRHFKCEEYLPSTFYSGDSIRYNHVSSEVS